MLGTRELVDTYNRLTVMISSFWNWERISGIESELQLEACHPALLGCPSLESAEGMDGADDPTSWNGLLWGVPKKRTSHMKKRQRMAHKYLKPKHNITVCRVCKGLKLFHTLCPNCLRKTLAETAQMRRELKEKVEASKQITGEVEEQA